MKIDEPEINYEGIQDATYRKALKKAYETKSDPGTVRLYLDVPFDSYRAFIRRFERNRMKYNSTGNYVSRSDIISHLMYIWGKEQKVNLVGNIFNQLIPDSVRDIVRRGKYKKHKIQANIFGSWDKPNEQTNQEEP